MSVKAPPPPSPRVISEALPQIPEPWNLGEGFWVLVGRLKLSHYINYRKTFGVPLDQALGKLSKDLESIETVTPENLSEMAVLEPVMELLCWFLSTRGKVVGPSFDEKKKCYVPHPDGKYDIEPISWETVADNVDLDAISNLDGDKFMLLLKDLGLVKPSETEGEAATGV